jgi:Na+-translocating ferredoxin:NAD+ oxidoreductase RnfD subunit
VRFPNVADPRVRLSIVVMTLQVLGQTVLGFKVSIAQIAVTIGTCAGIDAAITLWRRRALIWPASALLTGNAVAFILRVNGTRHGDWWSLNGAEIFAGTAAVAILSKYLVRPGGRHIFNPANLGLVLCFLVVGPTRVYPQYLWWGPLWPAVVVAWAVIVAGAFWVLRPLRMGPMMLAFFLPFALGVAALASAGSCFEAVWRADSVCGTNYWIGIATSPEVAIFVLFMMSDPRTAPGTRAGRALYGVLIALVALALLWPQPAEYGVKVAILASLVVVCSLVPAINLRTMAPEAPGRPRGIRNQTDGVAAATAFLLVFIALLLTASLASNDALTRSERGGGGGDLRGDGSTLRQ